MLAGLKEVIGEGRSRKIEVRSKEIYGSESSVLSEK